MPKVLNFEKEYLCARHPGVGFNRPTITPPTRASTKEKGKYYFSATLTKRGDFMYTPQKP